MASTVPLSAGVVGGELVWVDGKYEVPV